MNTTCNNDNEPYDDQRRHVWGPGGYCIHGCGTNQFVMLETDAKKLALFKKMPKIIDDLLGQMDESPATQAARNVMGEYSSLLAEYQKYKERGK